MSKLRADLKSFSDLVKQYEDVFTVERPYCTLDSIRFLLRLLSEDENVIGYKRSVRHRRKLYFKFFKVENKNAELKVLTKVVPKICPNFVKVLTLKRKHLTLKIY